MTHLIVPDVAFGAFITAYGERRPVTRLLQGVPPPRRLAHVEVQAANIQTRWISN